MGSWDRTPGGPGCPGCPGKQNYAVCHKERKAENEQRTGEIAKQRPERSAIDVAAAKGVPRFSFRVPDRGSGVGGWGLGAEGSGGFSLLARSALYIYYQRLHLHRELSEKVASTHNKIKQGCHSKDLVENGNNI